MRICDTGKNRLKSNNRKDNMVNPTDSWLLDFYDKHKDGKVLIEHFWNERESTTVITLSQLFKMFELAHERNENDAVHMD